jgi:hypothetical protein
MIRCGLSTRNHGNTFDLLYRRNKIWICRTHTSASLIRGPQNLSCPLSKRPRTVRLKLTRVPSNPQSKRHVDLPTDAQRPDRPCCPPVPASTTSPGAHFARGASLPAKKTRVKTTDADHCLAASTTVGMTHENSIHSTTRIPHTALQNATLAGQTPLC